MNLTRDVVVKFKMIWKFMTELQIRQFFSFPGGKIFIKLKQATYLHKFYHT